VRSRNFRKWAVANAVAAPSSAKQWACARAAFEVSSMTVECLHGAGPWCSIHGNLMRHAMNLVNDLLDPSQVGARHNVLETPMALYLNASCCGCLLKRHVQVSSIPSWR